ncbi:hypothetical protein [Nonomuraea typhae]|uniref:hypothetical protein n=1 Tax=Nonomuraea typhae TaxID=2603600 RepID=UPI001CA5CF3D|nr:hypothetical protein [Nonomuraea typhae]
MATVKIQLRESTPHLDSDGELITTGNGHGEKVARVRPGYDEVDLDRLSPRARTLAEAIAAAPLAVAAEIWVESDTPIRERLADWEHWYTSEQAGQPERRPWRGWSRYPATSGKDPHDWLEEQAAKIPPGWHVLGPTPRERIDSGAETGMTMEQVLAFLRERGRPIASSTWRAYVARGQAPRPARHVARTPLWDPAEILQFASGPGNA